MKKKNTTVKTSRIILASLYFLLFYFGLTTFLKTYGEFVSTVEPVASGKVDNVMYVDDLTSDYNYFKGLNYTKIINANNIPSATSTGYYDDQYLVKVRIIYDGVDINDSRVVGYVSPLSSENVNKYVYFKYYNGDNYIRVELPDNPFSRRPYVAGVEYGFNGWVCNDSEDTTDGVCDNTTMYFTKDNYTRYMDIACDGQDEFTIHLNASWTEADVVTSQNQINEFNDMSMQPMLDVTYTQEYGIKTIQLWYTHVLMYVVTDICHEVFGIKKIKTILLIDMFQILELDVETIEHVMLIPQILVVLLEDQIILVDQLLL